MMKLLLVIATLICLGSTNSCRHASPPKWSTTYAVRGTINIPYAELKEPFLAYYDGTIGSSRIDYYGDVVKTYQLSSMGSYGSSLKLAPVTTETQSNIVTCLQVNGTAQEKITPQTVLPDLQNFQCLGTYVIDGADTQKWGYVDTQGEKISKYTMWIRWTKRVQGSKQEPVPFRYEMQGYNSLLGSHYDHYYLNYDMYSSEAPSASVWQLEANMTCTNFPGPGIKSTASFNPMKEFIHNYDNHVEHAWNEFKTNYNKQYKDNSEHNKRRNHFRDNHRFIHSTNRAGLGYQLKINRYADWSMEDMKSIRGRKYTPGHNNGSVFPYQEDDIITKMKEVPSDFNWRLYGAVTPVKDQSICGSCWSFGSTGALEGAYFLKTGLLISLSEQALVDCSWGYGNNGCDGGEDFRSYQWVLKHGGLPLEGDYGSYLGQDGYCHASDVKLHAPITGYVNVTPNNENALRLALFKHGPISVAIDASQRTFTFYSNGVYSDPKCKNKIDELDHAVLAVGYGQLNGKRYWLIKNSWSNMWGNDGYVLISADKNMCGVMTSPTYVTM